ncbi:MAG TPA: hypothetical protein VG184_06630 [Acidimicrobiales bacterium]|nr:hypothetical protein [Acidimicrobiales bacterium]
MAPELSQNRGLLDGLHALGHDIEPQGVAQADDRPYHLGVAGVDPETSDEAAVDLDHVHREAPQVTQAGPPGTEVVDGDGDAHTLQLAQAGPHRQTGVDEGVLGELEAKQVGGKLPRGQGVAHLGDETGAHQLAGGDVDRHSKRYGLGFGALDPGAGREGQGGVPLGGLAAGQVEYAGSHGHDEPGLLCHVDEVCGPDQVPSRAPQAQERLHAGQVPVCQVDYGLIDEDEAVVVQGASQQFFGVEAAARLGLHGVVVDLPAVASPFLGPVQGGIGFLEQRARGVVV